MINSSFFKLLSFQYFLLLGLLSLFIITLPFGGDSGWILNIIDTNLQNNCIILTGTGLEFNWSFSRLYFDYLSKLESFIRFPYSMHINGFLFCSVGTLSFLKILQFYKVRNKFLLTTVFIFIFFSSGLVGSYRQETVYFNFFLLQFYLVINNYFKNKFIILISVFINCLSISVHPNGLFVPLINLIPIFSKSRNILLTLGIYTLTGIGSFFFLLHKIELIEFIDSLKLHSKFQSKIAWHKEYLRYLNFILRNKIQFFVLMAIIIGCLSSLKEKFFSNKTDIFLIAIISFILLFFVPLGSKWPEYLSVPLVLFLIFLLRKVEQKKHSRTYFYLIVVFSLTVVFSNLKKDEIFINNYLPNIISTRKQSLKKIDVIRTKYKNERLYLQDQIIYPFFRINSFKSTLIVKQDSLIDSGIFIFGDPSNNYFKNKNLEVLDHFYFRQKLYLVSKIYKNKEDPN
jgi:hypothetical protein